MFRPYYVVNLCLHELKTCRLPGSQKQKIERPLIVIKNLILDEDNHLLYEPEFVKLFHDIRYICSYDTSPSTMEELFVHMEELIERLQEKY